MAEKFIAITRLRWGDGWVEPGDDVPTDQGRNLSEMLAHGEIARVGDVPTRPNRERWKEVAERRREVEVEKLAEKKWTHPDTDEVFATKHEAVADAESGGAE